MKIKESYDLQQLKQFGFEDCNNNPDFNLDLPETKRKCDFISHTFGESVSHFNPDFVLSLGYSRRGQWYYCLIINREISIYASEPDGSGSSVDLPIEFIEFISAIKEYLE